MPREAGDRGGSGIPQGVVLTGAALIEVGERRGSGEVQVVEVEAGGRVPQRGQPLGVQVGQWFPVDALNYAED